MVEINLIGSRKILAWRYSNLVTLPKVWINHHKLGKKDSIMMKISNTGELILSPLQGEILGHKNDQVK